MAGDGEDETAEVVKDPAFPLTVRYCGECSMPFEFCDYSPAPDKCRKWAEQNAPEILEGLNLEEKEDGTGPEKKHQKRGGKGVSAPKEKKKEKGVVTLQRAPRGKNKSVTVIKGLHSFGIDLKVASKFLASKFACGSSVTGADEIVIQGDVKDDLFDLISEKWPAVSEDDIEDLGDQKR